MLTHPSWLRMQSVGALLYRGVRAAPLASLALLAVLAGCGLTNPLAGPPTAAQIFDRANHSDMKDAKLALSGNITTTASGAEFTLTMSGDGQIVLKPTSAYHMNLVMDLKSGQLTGKVTVDLIQVGGKAYTKTHADITGLPPSPDVQKYSAATVPDSQSNLVPQNQTALKVVGEDTIRGDKCWHLQGTMSTDAQGTPVAAGTSGSTSAKVDEWIRESDYFYVREKLDGLPGFSPLGSGSASSVSSGASDTGSGNVGFILDFSDYNTGATISAPPASDIAGS
jgi:predicted small lipoprotein YifL